MKENMKMEINKIENLKKNEKKDVKMKWKN
jgi:hypothetical protein